LEIFLILLVLVVLGSFAYAGILAAPWVPMRSQDIKSFLKLARIQSGQTVYDLGSGDGRLIIAAAKTGAISTGFEISILPFIISLIRVIFLPANLKSRVRIKFKNFFKADLSDADLVYVFLSQEKHNQLREKFEKELSSGAKVITYIWPIEGWMPSDSVAGPSQTKLYLYQR